MLLSQRLEGHDRVIVNINIPNASEEEYPVKGSRMYAIFTPVMIERLFSWIWELCGAIGIA